MKHAFTLIELLVVITIISVLTAVGLPVMRRVREQGVETVCRSNLRQMTLSLKTYCGDHDGSFPDPHYIYHSPSSFWYPGSPDERWKPYLACCRWHDARIGFDSLLLQEHPELRGALLPYIGNMKIVRCTVGCRANLERGCNNACIDCVHDPSIPIVPQYTYTMNVYLVSGIRTGRSATGDIGDPVDARTHRWTQVRKEIHVTRSPSEVFAFGEENSWAINKKGEQPVGTRREWAAPYDLSGIYYIELPPHERGLPGTITKGGLGIETTYWLRRTLAKKDDRDLGDAFATCHRPRKGDLNTGHSYVSMLDGHVQKVTVADQLRKSRQVPFLEDSRLGPGGNLRLAWPLDIPPPGGWENQ
jgi:prepilin-type N-terminal cleavage/methylation domain-containing protein